jgi:hypothetical protein
MLDFLDRFDQVDIIIITLISTIVTVGVLSIAMPKPAVTWSPITSPDPSLSCFRQDNRGHAVVCVDNDAE